jgi:hypothetical protein
MNVWQTFLVVGVIGGGGVLLYMALSKNRQRAVTATPQQSVVQAAYQGTGSSGDPPGTNKYDAILGIGGVVGGILESGIQKGWFSSSDSGTDEGIPPLLARP